MRRRHFRSPSARPAACRAGRTGESSSPSRPRARRRSPRRRLAPSPAHADSAACLVCRPSGLVVPPVRRPDLLQRPPWLAADPDPEVLLLRHHPRLVDASGEHDVAAEPFEIRAFATDFQDDAPGVLTRPPEPLAADRRVRKPAHEAPRSRGWATHSVPGVSAAWRALMSSRRCSVDEVRSASPRATMCTSKVIRIGGSYRWLTSRVGCPSVP